jgi:hypothetical protein
MLTSAIGIKRLAKSLIKPYSVDFGPLELRLTAAREEVKAEIRLASEQRAQSSRALQQIEFKANERHRSDFGVEIQENRVGRWLQRTEAMANSVFRSQQHAMTSEIKNRQVQRSVKEDGNIIPTRSYQPDV